MSCRILCGIANIANYLQRHKRMSDFFIFFAKIVVSTEQTIIHFIHLYEMRICGLDGYQRKNEVGRKKAMKK